MNKKFRKLILVLCMAGMVMGSMAGCGSESGGSAAV